MHDPNSGGADDGHPGPFARPAASHARHHMRAVAIAESKIASVGSTPPGMSRTANKNAGNIPTCAMPSCSKVNTRSPVTSDAYVVNGNDSSGSYGLFVNDICGAKPLRSVPSAIDPPPSFITSFTSAAIPLHVSAGSKTWLISNLSMFQLSPVCVV